MKYLIVLVCFLHACFCDPAADLDGVTRFLTEVKEEEVLPNGENEMLNATLFRTMKKYYCRVDTEEDSELLVYGTRAWTFPPQDVNLIFRYPSEDQVNANTEDEDSVVYLLTQLKVVFNLSGSDGRGYITSGGMLQEHIDMTFVFRNITSLAYQFYLHGVPRIANNVTENYAMTVNLC